MPSGITPAWAGKRAKPAAYLAPEEDHPRVGGEKGVQLGEVGFRLGSPPRGRGKAKYLDVTCTFDRITPAWAGKSSQRGRQKPPAQDHPRVGGEKAILA